MCGTAAKPATAVQSGAGGGVYPTHTHTLTHTLTHKPAGRCRRTSRCIESRRLLCTCMSPGMTHRCTAACPPANPNPHRFTAKTFRVPPAARPALDHGPASTPCEYSEYPLGDRTDRRRRALQKAIKIVRDLERPADLSGQAGSSAVGDRGSSAVGCEALDLALLFAHAARHGAVGPRPQRVAARTARWYSVTQGPPMGSVRLSQCPPGAVCA